MFTQEHKNLDIQIQETKKSIKFYNKLFMANSIESFLLLIYKESNKQFKIRSLILCYYSGHFGPTQYVCDSKGVHKKSCDSIPLDPAASKEQIRVKNREDSQYLADSLGRPVQNVFSIPIQTSQYGKNTSIILFVELVSSKSDKSLKFYESFLELMTRCLDRLLLQDHLETGIDLWNSTFNRLKEPLVIFDAESSVSNANDIFEKIFSNRDSEALSQKIFQWEERVFEKYSYPIDIKGSKYTICHYADISESLDLRSKLIQNIKMSALGELGETVAHELSNPLTGVFSMTQLLLESGKLSPEREADMKDIAKSVTRSQEIITNLLNFSRANPQLTVCDLNEVVQNTLPFLKSIIYSSEFQLEINKEPVQVQVQSCLLQEVIFNLIKNACQAISEQKEPLHQVKVRVYKEGKKAFLSVEDSGKGVNPKDYQNIFKAFFTTKSPGQGTGLGLSISRSIVQSFHGSLEVSRSSLGGACFTMLLPLE